MSAPGFTIYVITGPDGTEYVGCTGQTLADRFRGHAYSGKHIISPLSLAQAIRRHGPDAFSIRPIMENLVYEDACVAEQEAILARRMARVPLYNLRPGGTGGLFRSRHRKAA